MALSDDLILAQHAALAGASLGLEYFQRVKDLRIDYKTDGSYVTEADCCVEETVRSILLAERPNDACLGEETGEHGSGRRRWILDGIDGTAEFLRGESSWQTLIALEEDGTSDAAASLGRAAAQAEIKKQLDALIKTMQVPTDANISQIQQAVADKVVGAITQQTLAEFNLFGFADPDDFIGAQFVKTSMADLEAAGAAGVPVSMKFQKPGVDYRVSGVIRRN